MELSVIGVTKEFKDDNDNVSKDLEIFAGKNAGICYMSKPYDSESVSGIESALKRFKFTMKSGHHSVADHCKVTVLFENVPKIFAMILNSFQDYATSEKSARYTVMDNLSEQENFYYNKWRNKLNSLLCQWLPEPQAEKLANENARYFIDIFSPSTTFSYTTSIRQWNYIYGWIKNLIYIEYPGYEPDYIVSFASKLRPCLIEFANMFEDSLIYNELIRDNKARHIDLLPQLYPNLPSTIYEKETYGVSYCITYLASFTALAQLQRHRSIKYVINGLLPISLPLVYVPDFIKFAEDKSLKDEWVNDMRYCIKHYGLHPQGMLIKVAELGTIDKFLLKCDERLCGRVQYETMRVVANSVIKLYNSHSCSSYYSDELYKWIEFDDNNMVTGVKPKCKVLSSGCTEGKPCIFGSNKAINRTI